MRLVDRTARCALLLTVSALWIAACADGTNDTKRNDSTSDMAGVSAAPTSEPTTNAADGGGAPRAGAPAAEARAGHAGDGEPASSDSDCPTFDSSFAAIQKVIFEGHGCVAAACHGAAASGGLDLRPDAAYANLVNVKSTGSSLARVQPGTATDSFLFQKLAAATTPDRVQTPGRSVSAWIMPWPRSFSTSASL